MNKKTTIEIILLILILASIILPLVYLTIDNTLSVSYRKVLVGALNDNNLNDNPVYYKYLFETYKYLKANFITCIVSLVFFTVLLIVKLSGIKVDKILNFILTVIIVLFLMLFTGLAFGFLFYFVQEEIYDNTESWYPSYNDYKFGYLTERLEDLKEEIDRRKRKIKSLKQNAENINETKTKATLYALINELENELKSLEEQADKLEYLINLYYILIYSSFFTAGFLALLILTKLY